MPWFAAAPAAAGAAGAGTAAAGTGVTAAGLGSGAIGTGMTGAGLAGAGATSGLTTGGMAAGGGAAGGLAGMSTPQLFQLGLNGAELLKTNPGQMPTAGRLNSYSAPPPEPTAERMERSVPSYSFERAPEGDQQQMILERLRQLGMA